MGRFGYPALLELGGRRCVVVGSRAVSEGKVEALLDGGADDVLVVAEGPRARLGTLAADTRVRVERRPWRPGDLDGAFVVVGWDPDPAERARLAAEARARGALVNVIDDAPNCDFAAPAVVRRGHLVLAIGTGGASPALAAKLRGELEERFGPCWAELVEVLRAVRADGPRSLDAAERARRWRAALDLAEAERLVTEGRAGELRELLAARLRAEEEPG
jgi:precorrin-2 dehydrogenase/sirohydrochlorin ferrochelatase